MKALILWCVWLVLRVYVWIARRPCLCIHGPDGTPYLSRWTLNGPRLPEGDTNVTGRPGWYLHKFHRSDYDRDVHSHPWEWCGVLVIKGGYTEERIEDPDPVRRFIRRAPGDFYALTATSFHRTQLFDEDAGSWSLVCSGPKHGRGWGFRGPDGSYRSASGRVHGVK